MRTLVLSGGSIAGVRQAAWLVRLTALGHEWDQIVGTSVGALNGAFLAEMIGRGLDWHEAALALGRFWVGGRYGTGLAGGRGLEGPEQLITQRSLPALALGLALTRFRGLVDTAPLRRLIAETITESAGWSRVPAYAVVVDAESGAVETCQSGAELARYRQFVLASASEPVKMPMVEIDGRKFVDGGNREIIPVPSAIRLGATSITALVCQEAPRPPIAVNPGSLRDQVESFVRWATWEIGENDLRLTQEINANLAAASLASAGGRRYVRLQVVRPSKPLGFDIRRFSHEDLVRAWDEAMVDPGNIEQVDSEGRLAWHQGADRPA